MNGPATTKDLNMDLDIFGQAPSLLRLYTQLCFCYPVADASSHSAIIDTLTEGLERLTASFPWVAGQVASEGSVEGDPGVFKIKPLDKLPRLVVKDLRDDPSMPTMDTIRRANFPFSVLDECVIAPRNTLPEPSDFDPAPVFLLQANLIIDGLMLTFVANHAAMDMTGQAQIIYLLSKACRNEQFTSDELSSGNLDRRNVVPLLEESYEPSPVIEDQILEPATSSPSDAQTPLSPPKCSWAYFTFKSSALTALKLTATQTITSGFVSTDDALSAFIWQSVTRARLPRLNPTTQSTFARAIDARRFLGIPSTYTGLIQNMTYSTYKLQKLVEAPLGSVASLLRSALDPKTSDIGYNVRAYATELSRTKDKAGISVTSKINSSVDIMLSSWAKVDCYNLDFNLGLGKPEAVRRPRFPPVECLMYLMPKAPDGEIALGVCLRHEDMERLKADEEFTQYGTYVG